MKRKKSRGEKTAARSAKGSKSSSRPRKAKAARAGASAPKSPGTNPQRVSAILQKLDEAYPAVTCALVHENPFQLLISTILSAQCTDVRVNLVTRDLFQKYRTPKDFAYADPNEL